MATSGATRIYPSQVITADPTAANFESDLRTNTETLIIAVKDVDDEVSRARSGSSATYTTLSSRLNAIEAASGAEGTLWTPDTGFNAIAGDSYFTTTGDKTSTFVKNRPLKFTTSTGSVYYGYVLNSNYTTETTVSIASDNLETPLTITGSVSEIAYAAASYQSLWVLDSNKLSSAALAELRGSSLALSIALG